MLEATTQELKILIADSKRATCVYENEQKIGEMLDVELEQFLSSSKISQCCQDDLVPAAAVGLIIISGSQSCKLFQCLPCRGRDGADAASLSKPVATWTKRG
jgi:hypothetical protein